jgi:CHAT domain-containing protein
MHLNLRTVALLPLFVLAAASGCRERRANPPPAAALDILEQAEASKCSRVQKRLNAAGVRSHGLPRCDQVKLPKLRSSEAVLSFTINGDSIERRWAHGATPPRQLPSLRLATTERLVMVVRDALEHGDPQKLAPLQRGLARLSRLLLANLGDELRGLSRLLMLPDGLLKVVPFHALPAPRLEAKGPSLPPLVTTLELTQAPCLALALRPGGRPGRAVLLTPGYTSSATSAATSRPSLPGAAAEAEAVRTAFPATRHLAGRQATAARLHAALTARATLVHFAGHGLADLSANSPPELLFAQRDPPATVRSVSQRRVRASLVVLAACTAAYAARFRDEKRLVAETNLVEALLAAGAHSVVAASWVVKDRLSQQQMSAFYTQLRRHPPATALTLVQRREIKRIRPPHPRYWATYAVYGGWHREGWSRRRAYK